jgi:hypothetical protein
MFESALINHLRADAELVSYVSTFNLNPSIFSDLAPEGAALPYLVFRILRLSSGVSTIARFSIFFDYFAFDLSRTTARKAVDKLESILDMIILNHDRYGFIRIFYFGGSMIEEPDPRDIHYNLQFSARSTRKNWVKQFS